MAKGVVKWFNNKKGFGFIAQEGSDKDLFVHFSNIKGDGFKTLQEGDPVEYDVTESDKGLKAVNVTRASSEVRAS